MALGISRIAEHRNKNFLNTLIYTGIQQGLLPSSFKKVIGNNIYPTLWKTAYYDGLDDGFEYATYGQEDTDFYKRFGNAATAMMNHHTDLWRTKQYQEFRYMSQMGLKIIQQGAPSLLPTFSKVLIHLIRNRIVITSKIQKILAKNMAIDLTVQPQSQGQNQKIVSNCQCVKTGMNGLDGGQVAEPNKVNWGNVAKTVLLGGAAGFGVHKAIEHFTDRPKKQTGLSGLSKGQRKGFDKLKKITARAKQIQKTNPRKKWTTCISQAARELK